MEKRTAAIVVTYNRKELLKENIEALLAQTYKDNLDIIVINNASTDGTEEYISDYINRRAIIHINTGANLGGAGGFQYGIRYATENGYDFVWVMDDDCMPTPNALEVFYKWDQKLNGKYGFLSSKVLWKNGEICKMNVQRETITKNVTDFSKRLIQVEMASFVSLFIPIPIVRKVGLPIKEFFIWTDDWEYTRRISREYPCFLTTKSVVIHKSNSNIGASIVSESADRLDRFNYLYRNDVYLYRREGLKGFTYEAVRLTSHIFKILLKAPDNKMKRIEYVVSGTKKGLHFQPEIEYVTTESKLRKKNESIVYFK